MFKLELRLDKILGINQLPIGFLMAIQVNLMALAEVTDKSYIFNFACNN
jgi:hypothetical protein